MSKPEIKETVVKASETFPDEQFDFAVCPKCLSEVPKALVCECRLSVVDEARTRFLCPKCAADILTAFDER